MSPAPTQACTRAEQVAEYALGALPDRDKGDLEAHLATCASCREELTALRGMLGSFAYWPTEVVRPSPILWDRVADRIGSRTAANLPARSDDWAEPAWEEVAPGISVKILAADHAKDRVSMLVRLQPNTHYPPHSHAGTEELHLLEGELWIEDRKLLAGDYNYREAGTADQRVYSETGCTCVLITSPSDQLGR